MYVNTLESSSPQELWKYVEGVNENKTPVPMAKDFFIDRSVICWEGTWSISRKFIAGKHLVEIENKRTERKLLLDTCFSFMDDNQFWIFINHCQGCKAQSAYLYMFHRLSHIFKINDVSKQIHFFVIQYFPNVKTMI